MHGSMSFLSEPISCLQANGGPARWARQRLDVENDTSPDEEEKHISSQHELLGRNYVATGRAGLSEHKLDSRQRQEQTHT